MSLQISELSTSEILRSTSTFEIIRERSKLVFSIGLVAMSILLIVMITVLVLLYTRRKLQALKQRSPKLIMLSVLGHCFFAISLLLQGLFFSGCIMQENDVSLKCPSGFCSSEVVSKLNCLLGLLALAVFEPMAVIPYWCRTIRIYTIFKAQEFYFRYKKKPEAWFKWIKEPIMFKICLLILSTSFLITVGLFIAILFKQDIAHYIPSYTVYMCFMNGMCDSEKPNAELNQIIEQHVNNTIIWLIIINVLGNIFFVTCIYKLRNIKSEFNIRIEMFLTFIVWFITTQLALGLSIIYADDKPNFDWVYLILVVRSIASVIMTVTRPIYLSMRGNPFILLPPNQESIETLDMVLQIPIATEYFYEFLEKHCSKEDPQVTCYFSLYVDLRQFDRAVVQGTLDIEIIQQKAQEIYDDYLSEQGNFYVPINPEVYNITVQKLQKFKSESPLSCSSNSQQQCNQLLFIELLSFVLDRMKAHFQSFKRSPMFVELEEEIQRQEKLYEVLVDASIITN